MNFAKYRVQLSTEKKYWSKYVYKYEYSIPVACAESIFTLYGNLAKCFLRPFVIGSSRRNKVRI